MDDVKPRSYVSLKVFMGNLDQKSYVVMAAKDERQFLQCTCCLAQHSFGQTHHRGAIMAALAKPGIPLIRKIHDATGPWQEMMKVLPNRGARALAKEEMQ